MYNRTEQILEQYPFSVNQTYKGRGTIICDTDKGLKILKEYKGSQARADFLYKILLFLKENGIKRVDGIVKTKEEGTIAVDVDETAYMVRDWYEGKECDVKNRDDIIKAIRQLAVLHNIFRSFTDDIPDFLKVSSDTLLKENEKHYRELKKVKNYIGAKKKKNDFEIAFAKSCDVFMNQARWVIELQQKEQAALEQKEEQAAPEQKEQTALEQKEEQTAPEQNEESIYGICHGDFNYHNVIFSREGVTVLNYEKALYDVQAGDLSNFMRKILEKHNWNLGLGMDMLDAYNKVRLLTEAEMKQLYIRLAYPEKFWKISNHYYNSNKAWMCSRDLEKLSKVVGQEEAKERFLQIISHNLLF